MFFKIINKYQILAYMSPPLVRKMDQEAYQIQLKSSLLKIWLKPRKAMFMCHNSNLLMDHPQMDHQIMIMLLIMANSYIILRVYRGTLKKELLLIKIFRVLKSIWRIQKNLRWTSKIQNHLISAVKKQNSKVRLPV